MKISWRDVNETEEPGNFPFQGGYLSIKASEIAIWKEHPDAVFTVVPFQATVGPKRCVLGSYEVDD